MIPAAFNPPFTGKEIFIGRVLLQAKGRVEEHAYGCLRRPPP